MKEPEGKELEELLAAIDLLAQRWLAWRSAGRGVQEAEDSYLVSEAAERLGIPDRTLREWVRTGKVPSLPPDFGDRGVRIPAQAIEDLRQALSRAHRRAATLPRI